MPKNLRASIEWVAFAAFGLLLIAFFAYICHAFVQNWQLGYSSDVALIGLMAKHIAEFGERPLFVWSVGYQGVLLEGYLAALFFKLWGVSPVVHSLAPTLYLWLGVLLWTSNVWRIYGKTIALLSAFFTIFSIPDFYLLHTRSLPNFSATLFLSGLLGSAFLSLIKGYQEPARARSSVLFLFGVLCGFSLYTFAISGYYLITFGLILLCFRLQDFLWPLNPGLSGTSGQRILLSMAWPSLQLDSVKLPSSSKGFILTLTGLAWIFLVIGLVSLFFTPEPFLWSGRLLKWNPLAILAGAILILSTANLLRYWQFVLSQMRAFLGSRLGVCLTMGFVLGYSPAFYAKFILGERSTKPMGIFGNWQDILRRFEYFFSFHERLFHFEHLSFLALPLTWLCVAGLVFFLGSHGMQGFRRNPATGQLGSRHQPGLFFAVFPLVVLGIFLVSRMVVDIHSGRYLIFLVPCYGAMLAWSVGFLWRQGKLGKALALVCFGLLTYSKGKSLLEYAARKSGIESIALAETMKKHSLRYAYADYWLAYSTVFLTNEELILEPLYSNYSPHYGPMLKEQDRIGYAVFKNSKQDVLDEGGSVEVQGVRYTETSKIDVGGGVVLHIVQRTDL